MLSSYEYFIFCRADCLSSAFSCRNEFKFQHCSTSSSAFLPRLFNSTSQQMSFDIFLLIMQRVIFHDA